MENLTVEDIIKRADNAWKIKDQWKPILQDAYELAVPALNPYGGNKKNYRPMDRQFDSTATFSVMKAANRLLMELTPPDQTWFDAKAGPLLEVQYEKAQLDQLNKDLDKDINILATVFRSGRFINAIWETFLDLLVSGMGVMLVTDDSQNDLEPVNFQAVSQAEVAIEDGPNHNAEEVYRRRRVKIRNIKRLWSDAKMPQELLGMMRQGNDPEIDVLEVTYYDPENSIHPYRYEIIWREKKNGVRLVERNYATKPWKIFRWSKLPGSPYGPSPVMLALADIRTANKVKEMILQNGSLALAGMYMVRDDGVLNPNNVMITMGGLIPVQSTGGTMGPSIAPLETGRGFDVGQIILNDLQNSIKKALFDNSLPPMSGPVRSPTEIIERLRELTQDIGGAIGRLTTDLVDIVRTTAEILYRRGFIRTDRFDQYVLKIQINSPLARSQQLQEVETIVRWIEIARSIGGPEMVMLIIKLEDAIINIAEKMGIPSELQRSAVEKQKIQQQIAATISGQAAEASPMMTA